MTPYEKMPLLPRSPRMDNLDEVLKEPPSPRRVDEIKKVEKLFQKSVNDDKTPLIEKKRSASC